ncbi:transcription antitermination regulator [Streptomyces chrestomyceticus JCM 4735]|uniref:Transcription antitermination regulator n=1 Tax=Streptomyces chrestomyceticus JCM 4735 TaxID=1306181 RepID=A0A7U9L2I4_9ACTN|nr:PP2C family protein-serine/threonine phosphatase [Streptomyces chrestomyceticus]GCD39874.1 transcription antitermination regulator [Streptomyces chrestomyceticus JCM 4735]
MTGAVPSAARVAELLVRHLGCDAAQARACASGLLGLLEAPSAAGEASMRGGGIRLEGVADTNLPGQAVPVPARSGAGAVPGVPGNGSAASAGTVRGTGSLTGDAEHHALRTSLADGRAGTVPHGCDPSPSHAPGISPGPTDDAVDLATAPGPVELAQRLYERVKPSGATAVLLAVLDMEGVLRMTGAAGPAARADGDWSQVPLHRVLPLARKAATDHQVWLDDESGGRTLTWISARSDAPDTPCHPTGARESAIGTGARTATGTNALVCVVRPGSAPPSPAARARLEALTDCAGRRLRGLAALGLPDDGVRAAWLGAALDAVPVPAALLFPVRGPLGRVVEFTVDRCNAHATGLLGRTPEQITGSRLLDVFPGMLLSGIFDACVTVLETGEPLDLDPFPYEEPRRGVLHPALLSVRARRVGGGLLVSWQFHDEQARLTARIDDAERLADLGWAEWNLATGEATWSRRMYDIFGLAPGSGPLSLGALSGYVVEDDLPAVVRAVQSLSRNHGPVWFEVRTRAAGRLRHVSVNAELVRDSLGNPVALRGVVQDVSRVRRVEAALDASRREAERRQLRMAEELQLALLPRAHTALPGLRAAIRYQPAENCARVGGDWFEATPLPDGRVLIAIGDVLGHGLQAAAGMAQLRNALLGIAYTGADAAHVLECLNLVAFHGHDESLTATAAVGHFDPVRRTLSWARAGHPPPVLVRGGRATELVNDDGTTLGASLDPGYVCKTLSLTPGDRLILYTDGLVERRADRAGDREDLLLAAARRGAAGSPEEHLETLLSVLHTNPEDDTCVIVLHVGS